MREHFGIGGAGLAAVAVLALGCSSDGGSGPSQTATTIAVASGSFQAGTVGTTLPTPIGVRVTDAGGDPVAGVAVTFAVTAGGGAVAAAAPVTTNAQGVASTTWTIGTVAGVSNNVATATAAGLSGSPVTFTATGQAGTAVEVVAVSGNNQNARHFTTAANPLVAQVNDAYGNAVPGATVVWTIFGGGSAPIGTVVTNGLGQTSIMRTVGGTMSGYITTATITTGGGAFFDFVTLGTAVNSNYNVEVQFLTPVTTTQRAAFLNAAARWSSTIIDDFAPDQVVADSGSCGSNTPAIDQEITSVLIYATVAPIDGINGILGGASPCWVRLPGYLTLVGDMTFDVADLPQLEALSLLEPVILHEMGHVLGIGTLWTYVTPSLLTNGGTADPYFNGAAGISAFDAAGGTAAYAGAPVPVENTGGPGTRDGHWRETILVNELMTGYINPGSNPLSDITIASLGDLLYTVSYSASDDYTVPMPSPVAPLTAGVGSIQLKEQVRTGPIRGVDRQGRITRVR